VPGHTLWEASPFFENPFDFENPKMSASPVSDETRDATAPNISMRQSHATKSEPRYTR
jgi:hypothetical protein